MNTEFCRAVQEKRFEYKGFPCVILMQCMAFRTGYVGIPKGHKYYEKDYDSIDIHCHGGLTYSEKYLALQEDENIWWIGFDTGHYCDGKDYDRARELFANYPKSLEQLNLMQSIESKFISNEHIRTLEYCEEQCKEIVEQLLA